MTNPLVPEEETELLNAVRGLTSEVRGLRDRLDTLYAPRDEVKREGRRRAWRFLGFAVVIILVAQGFSMTTISYCFLDANNANSAYCKLMPGYDQAVTQGGERLERFERLLGGIEATNARSKKNEDRLNQIDRRLKKLEEAQ